MENISDWLLEGPEWIRYVTTKDLLAVRDETEAQVNLHELLLKDTLISSLVKSAAAWESSPLRRHNDADHPIHKINFLADLGFTKRQSSISSLAEKILNHQDPTGPFLTLSNFPTHFGGSGKDEWLWVLCDAPLLTNALIKFGYGNETLVLDSLNYLKSLVGENGWLCTACAQLRNFRGPGKKDDPCPYANMIMLKTLATAGDLESAPVKRGIETLLGLWDNSREKRPYLFKMGNDFRKLKTPFIWYDILHLTEVLSQFPQVYSDNSFQEMISIILSKSDDKGRYTSESIWTKWTGWEFCQKQEPSRWVTLCVLRILKRIGNKNFRQ